MGSDGTCHVCVLDDKCDAACPVGMRGTWGRGVEVVL